MSFFGKIHNAITRVFGSDTAQTVQSTDTRNSAPNSVYECKNNGQQSVVDTFGYSGSDFEKYCKKNKISEAELSESVRGVFSSDDKINSSPEEIQKAKMCLEAAYKYLVNKDDEFDTKKLKDLAEQYYIAINTGWNIDEFQEEQDKLFGKNRSLKSDYNSYCLKHLKFGKLFAGLLGKDITADEETFKKYITDSMVDIDKEARKSLKEKGIINPDNNAIMQEKKELQIKIFGSILANTPSEHRDMMMKAVKHLFEENRYNAVDVTLSASVDKEEAAHNYLEDRNEICNGVSNDDSLKMQELGYHYATKSDAEKYSAEDIENAKAFFSQHPDINPDELMQKWQSGAELSATEQEALTPLCMLSGTQSGIAGNVMMSEFDRQYVLCSCNQNLSDNNLYSSVTAMSAKYIAQNPDTALVSAEKFCKVMNESLPANAQKLIINEEGKIVEVPVDAKNQTGETGTKTITAENATLQTKNNQQKTKESNVQDINAKSKNITNPLREDLSAKNKQNSFGTLSTLDFNRNTETSEVQKKKTRTTSELVKELGSKAKAIQTVLDNPQAYETWVQNDMAALLKKSDPSEQQVILSCVSYDSFIMLIEQMSQTERVDLIQGNSKLDVTRKEIIKKQYIWDEELLNKAENKVYAHVET